MAGNLAHPGKTCIALFLCLALLLPLSPNAETDSIHGFQTDLEPAWKSLRSGYVESAKAAFTEALRETPGRIEARNGLGYVALRENNLVEATAFFTSVLKISPDDRDALVGQALVDRRRGELARAARRLIRVLNRHPEDGEAHDLLADVKAARESSIARSPLHETHFPPPVRPEHLDLPMRARGRVLEIRGKNGGYRPIFLKAINLGAALPGTFPGEFRASGKLYRDWFRKMRECGFTAVRLYTIFPPVFYESLASFNAGRVDPLYLIHGVWVELPPGNDFEDPAYVESFRAEIRRVVDLLHGTLALPERPGRASGTYRTDVSPWWIATILGREWEPFAAAGFMEKNPGNRDFNGRFIRGRKVNTMERWLAEQADYAVAYETDRFRAQRPVAWANWPTLDPLRHPTESTKDEEDEWRRRLGMPSEPHWPQVYDNDAVGIDLEKFAATRENHGGLFAAYHAYPYFPDFMIFDPGYLAAEDEKGPNAYLGYLRDLIGHHRKHPVLIAEFGVPTSRDVAHIHPHGFTHGGHSEEEQGRIDARLFRTIYASGAAGGALFSWIDEWFKHNWLVKEYHLPVERNPLWHDRQDAEQNYGLIGYRAGAGEPSVIIDGRDDEWEDRDILLSVKSRGGGIIRSLSVRSDETDLFLLLRVARDTRAGFAVMVDVVDPAIGDYRFAGGLDLKSTVGFEAALLFDGQRARLVIDRPYDRHSNRVRKPIRPRANDAGAYLSPKTVPNRMRITRAGKIISATVIDIGRLRQGTTDRSDTGFDDRAEWSFDGKTGVAEFRIPWGMLNVTDPSSRSVLFEREGYPGRYRETEGFRFAVAAFSPGDGEKIRSRDGKAIDVLPRKDTNGFVSDLPLYTWERWEKPTYHSFVKRSFDILRDALRAIPGTPLMDPPENASSR